jgi:hypothetical protein
MNSPSKHGNLEDRLPYFTTLWNTVAPQLDGYNCIIRMSPTLLDKLGEEGQGFFLHMAW